MPNFILKQIPNGPETTISGVMTVGRNAYNTLRLSYLSDGDRIRFGPLECVFCIPPPAAKSGGAARGRFVPASNAH